MPGRPRGGRARRCWRRSYIKFLDFPAPIREPIQPRATKRVALESDVLYQGGRRNGLEIDAGSPRVHDSVAGEQNARAVHNRHSRAAVSARRAVVLPEDAVLHGDAVVAADVDEVAIDTIGVDGVDQHAVVLGEIEGVLPLVLRNVGAVGPG